MKILVMGYSGAGKSTLARALGRKYNCPALYLDTLQFEAGWREREPGEAEALAEAFLDANQAWVIDGNYVGRFAYERRCREADWIIQLLLPRHVCLYRAVKRYLQNRGRSRESMAPGCEEKIDWEFIRWILWDGRRRECREGFGHLATAYPGKTLACMSRREAEAVLRRLPPEEKRGAPH